MSLLIRGLHIEELIIGMDSEEEQPEPVQEETKPQEPKKEEPKKEPVKAAPKKTKPIDKGKIGALRKAGWTIAEIADEMKCSQPTVSKILKEMNL